MMIIWQTVPLMPPTCTMIIMLMLIVFSPVFHKLCAGHSGHCYLTLLAHNLMVIVMLAAMMICLYKGVCACVIEGAKLGVMRLQFLDWSKPNDEMMSIVSGDHNLPLALAT